VDPLLEADDGVRTRDPQLGKLMLYQLSYVREAFTLAASSRLRPSRPGLFKRFFKHPAPLALSGSDKEEDALREKGVFNSRRGTALC
jgi:hypothetical protein